MHAKTNFGGLLGKSSRLMSNVLDAKLQEIGLTSQQWVVLAELSVSDGCNQTKLAKSLLKNKASVGSLVNYLVKKDCVTRATSQEDRRETAIVLTPIGRAIFAKSKPMVKEVLRQATQGLMPEEEAVSKKVLLQIINNLGGKS